MLSSRRNLSVMGLLVGVALVSCGVSEPGVEEEDAARDVPRSGAEAGAVPAPSVPPAPPSGTVDGGALPVPEDVVWARESVHPLRWKTPAGLPPLAETVRIEQAVDGLDWSTVAYVLREAEYQRWTLPSEGSSVRARVCFYSTDARGFETTYRCDETPPVKLGPSQKKNYAWQKVLSNAPFGPRDGAGGVVFGGKMWLIGGWNGDIFPLTTSNDVWSSTDGVSWTLEKPNTFLDAATFDRTRDWEGRHFAGYHVFDGKMWIVGGDVNQGHYQTDSWSSTDGITWTRRDRHQTVVRTRLDNDPTSPTYNQQVPWEGFAPIDVADFGKRTLHITGVFQGKLWVMGGQRIEQFSDPVWPGAPAALFNDLWTSTDGSAYTQVTPVGSHFSPRGNVGEAVELAGRMWVIGGGQYDDPSAGILQRTFSNEVWSTPDGVAWRQARSPAPFSPRVWHNVKAFDGRMWVINGYDGPELGQGRLGDNLPDVWYSVDGESWYEASPPPEYLGRHAGTAWVHAGALFVGSGNAFGDDPAAPGLGKWFADVWKMTPAP